MYNKKLLSVLVSCAILGGCGSSSDDKAENKAPTIQVNDVTLTEKANSTLSVIATDEDGTIVSYKWVQTAGPSLDISGENTDTITFVTPAIDVDTALSFNITVVDNDGAETAIDYNLVINRIETVYQLTGKVAANGFNNSSITASVAAESETTQTNDAGEFSFTLAIDDDEDINKSVTIMVGETNEKQLAILYPSIESMTIAEQSDSSAMSTLNQNVHTQTNIDSTKLSISAISTAQYSLLIANNNGEIPTYKEEVQRLESQLNPDLVLEAAAVINIMVESEDDILEEGIGLISSITNPENYNTLLDNIETSLPGAIEKNIEEITENPELTDLLTPEKVAPIYYQTDAAAQSFVARSGERYEFNQTGIGSVTNFNGLSEFDWSVNNNTIEIDFSRNAHGLIINQYVDSIESLTNEEKALLRSHGYELVPVEYKNVSSSLTRILSGSVIDTFRESSLQRETVLAINDADFQFEAKSYDFEMEDRNILMRKSVTSDKAFDAESMVGLWGFEVFRNNDPYSPSEFEILDFNVNGTGVSLDSEDSFSWTVTDEGLSLNFSEFQHNINLIDYLDGQYAVLNEVVDVKSGDQIAVEFGLGFQIEDEVTFTENSALTGEKHYFQTMVNQWTAASWDNDTLKYCDSYSTEAQCYAYGGIMFGFQTQSDNIGTKYASPVDQFPPNLTDYYKEPLNWEITENGNLRFNHTGLGCYDDYSQNCRYREWNLLSIVDGKIGQRIYVQEVDMRREDNQSTGEWQPLIYPRWNMYELIEIEYFNKTAATVEMVDIGQLAVDSIYQPVAKATKTNHTVLFPSKSINIEK
ncbi:hypothetical protein BCU94_10805 [Shewanella sp. 10N.286.52.C2]|uniref:PKD domain-containing protein n=1 Tax=Shewanella sp. 10N.286.52.C2 TaxID=1880838 RepID=UPI000C8582C9|nr:hypothetical protein [Shewanella sp. 10N.286.52.C2]PMG30486.1 hypothetical protein BCU94_10805 [Shewanella sp. 10N.286.52.C2]